ncbi:hypothetical protein [Chitinophaga sp. S165]|uniref:HD domain-containing protein n=1 Tax=Chitinophaga sp. S165 TaxID=2135462 RepID=UPI000D715FB6|nr:hypothetical protein [Chitinophaga sp. S165]PWV49532.1 putative metal-dependent HD superfamily phosphohydrolase [Chitinophaga sp. S165]
MTFLLQNFWQQLLERYTDNQDLIDEGYRIIDTRYSEQHRHYHNLRHIDIMIDLQQVHAHHITDNDTVSFAIFFHDIVYDVKQSDNEELSALAARAFLQRTSFPAERIAEVMAFIRATKSHLNTSNNTDLDYFLDFDLSILGTGDREYFTYAEQIRREYRMYSDTQFKIGRKKVLAHFLALPAIYKTAIFREEREAIARENLDTELRMFADV